MRNGTARRHSGCARAGRNDTRARQFAAVVPALLATLVLTPAPAHAQTATLQPVVQTVLDGAGRFGSAIAIDGPAAAIGAPGDYGGGGIGPPILLMGSAYIYSQTGGSWAQQAAIQDPTGKIGTNFGYAVAVSGNTVVIGAPDAVVGNGHSMGAAYVYVQSGNTWSLQATLTAADAVDGEFGGAVAIQGDTILVGAWQNNAAYIFTRTGSTWTQQAELTPADAGPYDTFGSAVALSNGTALIGASFHNNEAGAAYVFVQSGAQWNLQTELTGLDTVAGDYFGYSVALDGDTALIGAYWKNQYRGAAYVFTRAAEAWTQQAELTASDQVPNAYFGTSVALSGGAAVVDGQIDFSGAAYVFNLLGATWAQQAELTDGNNDGYGAQVALSGNTMLVSAFQDSVYVYQIPGGPLVLNAASLAPGPIAPGEALALFANLGPDDGVTATPSASGLLPTQLAGVQVFFDGVAAPLYYAQSQQVNVQAPFELANPTTQIRIVYHNQATWASTVAVQPAAPGIFHADGGDSSQALLLNQDGTYNSAANPAPRGSVVALWGTGGGAIAPAGITGGFTPLDSLAPLGQPVTVSVGGVAAQVTYQGVAPTLSTAVFQVNFEIPASAAAGPSVPLSLSIGTVTSSNPPAGTTIAVK